ncbi:glucan biosynthesis protein [Luteolibacter ambystomatis]|uniref:Glucan biosynthesis protein n=1 Tax=Luteolibacter ambystomatis TaxID=2824561 RepID=A0A975G4R4_9BACT|nr:glucan biosynthesis protein [Luteolibacter ambystomatis]QUE49309.1 glucan biosynthesis protein [Luteolibacter ambystomatis]
MYPRTAFLFSCLLIHSAAAAEAPLHRAEAERLAGQPYAPGWTPPTEFTKALTYDQMRGIHIKRQGWLFNDSQVQVEPLLAGSFNSKGLRIGLLEGGEVREVPFSAALFEFPSGMAAPQDKDLSGFKGFRVHGAPRTGANSYEQFSFGGASYFRGHPEGFNYGLSARGLILRRDGKEEFPMFERFVFEKPEDGSSVMVWHALLNGPSATGAFRFTSRPGNPHVMEIQADLFPRSGVAWSDLGVGLAGFSSMYWFSPADARRTADFRGRVHDSEALAIDAEDGSRLWRVLGNPAKVRTSVFPVHGLRGFGLVQRDRTFDAYQDDTARYERRTSAWVEPQEGMTAGEVKLVEIPTRGEYDDNIVASFTPELPAGSREPLHVAYRLLWCEDAPAAKGPRVVQTRTGRLPDKSGITLLAVDFATSLPVASLKPEVELPAGVEQRFTYLKAMPDGKTVRLHLGVVPKAGEATTGEIRAGLLHDGTRTGETWAYPWTGGVEAAP